MIHKLTLENIVSVAKIGGGNDSGVYNIRLPKGMIVVIHKTLDMVQGQGVSHGYYQIVTTYYFTSFTVTHTLHNSRTITE